MFQKGDKFSDDYKSQSANYDGEMTTNIDREKIEIIDVNDNFYFFRTIILPF